MWNYIWLLNMEVEEQMLLQSWKDDEQAILKQNAEREISLLSFEFLCQLLRRENCDCAVISTPKRRQDRNANNSSFLSRTLKLHR